VNGDATDIVFGQLDLAGIGLPARMHLYSVLAQD
jgi:hypothetical protein